MYLSKKDVEQDITPPWKNKKLVCVIIMSIETYSLALLSTFQQVINVPPHLFYHILTFSQL